MLTFRTLAVIVGLVASAPAQETPQKPEVRINYLNVCAPTAEEQQVLKAALDSVPKMPAFASDFEIARGRSTMPDAPPASFVRVRREFPHGPFNTVQYSVSVDESAIVETLVFRLRDPKDVMQIAISQSVTGAVNIEDVLAADTPAARVKVERFGKSSVALARCPQGDQSAYEPLFAQASGVLKSYRSALNVQRTVPADLARLGVKTKPAARPAAKPKKQ